MTEDTPKSGYPPKELSNEALEWIVRLHSGEARKRDWADFADWRARSDEHEAAAAEAEALWNDASELHWDARTGSVRPGRQAKPVVSRRAVLGGIAGVGLAGGGALWATGAFRSLLADHATGVAEIRNIDLPDGTRVTLNAMSALNVDFSALRRRVALIQGQAYFEVAPDAERPFEVDARGTLVSALGTAFDIDSNLADGRMRVSVTEHSVRVEPSGVPQSRGIILVEGHKVMVSGTGQIGPVAEQDRAAALAWKTGMLVAENLALEDVIAALRAYHSGWIIVQDSSVKTLQVNAALDLRKPSESLEALAAGLPIRIRRLSEFLTVISAA